LIYKKERYNKSSPAKEHFGRLNLNYMEIGKVTHWYDKLGVAVIKLEAPLKVGDNIKVSRGDVEFEETVSSMQIDHKEVDGGKKGDEIAMKLSQKAKVGSTISKVE